ncbi:MAG: ATP-dependent RNA helicase [Anaerolineae bacterium]|nr:ATP-dependent RNA helicase [Thermoflexales bacterium]MDW8406408.1 ATP-dependent RNA helicase [Anaerolineae bacterium]
MLIPVYFQTGGFQSNIIKTKQTAGIIQHTATIRRPMQTDLPIWQLHNALRAAWRTHNRFVLIAPTGSGKTTQVCQMMAQDETLAKDRHIVILQPRRVAARSVARRVADEMGVALGSVVGYQVRFEDALSPDTRIAFVTEGVLLRWLQDDPALGRVGAILFDEFHERTLFSDVALAIAKQLQNRTRPDLLLGVLSATLEAQPVAAYLGNCPILEAEGRQFPVEIHYQGWRDDADIWERAAEKVDQILRETDEGDILVFMPGAYEIARTLEEIRRALSRAPRQNVIVLPLHGELPPEEQDRAFIPTPYRRVIVSTNVAETSVTIPGIRYVVDSGLARIARYDPQRGLDTLHIEPISQASADQRAGRAGRIAPGVCYRLWSEADHARRPARNTPEIQRTDLAEAVLLLYSLGQTDVAGFDFLDKPQPERLRHAEELLSLLGAIEIGRGLTPLGRQMIRLPMHPRYARMVIEASRYGCVREVALLAALVSGRDLFTRLDRNDQSARRNRERLYQAAGRLAGQSDFFVLSQAFAHAVQHNFNPKACYSHGIHPHAAREVAQAYRQIIGLCEQAGLGSSISTKEMPLLPPTMKEAAGEGVARCHLAGFIDQLAVRTSSGTDEFELAGGRRGTLMDESAVKRALLIVVSEMREIVTRAGSRLNLIGLASAIKPEWVRALNPPGLSERVEYVYERLNKRVVAGQVLRYHDLIIAGRPLDPAEFDLDEAARTLAREFSNQLDTLPACTHELKQWLLRVRLVSELVPELGLPTIDRAFIERALTIAWRGVLTLKEAVERPLSAAFERLLTVEQRAALERLAPSTIELMPGKSVRIVYLDGSPPEAAIKLDEARRLTVQPAIVEGRQPLRLRLYGPDNSIVGVVDDVRLLNRT